MDFLNAALSMIKHFGSDLSGGRLIEGLVLLGFTWRKVKPHLEALEKRLEGLERAVQDGFKSGDTRFLRIEQRVSALEQSTQAKGGSHEINRIV